ncbi:uncharacterized protein CANTADRAFT_284668 [Suhomyces tanzawaensis NRRL Y-17324]|uniref:Uncharacterized protein n=1 Tax=Suhomyces tanzawaensis NRRL Y-17324 TaxID=984487 RepID=A0A1E4SEG2_9ASCO|nr:uncharacterized protein CANTADRAFT_284668 [Suhomyces tanzawaensis NRRL Y-17324]ODV77873.1 hypothetical protein CANTADRAFT_284668 [Suhomyces tanzawaensis NRRL Y-17324]
MDSGMHPGSDTIWHPGFGCGNGLWRITCGSVSASAPLFPHPKPPSVLCIHDTNPSSETPPAGLAFGANASVRRLLFHYIKCSKDVSGTFCFPEPLWHQILGLHSGVHSTYGTNDSAIFQNSTTW